MTIEPAPDWSTVVIGHWNRAILLPQFIAQHLYCLEENTPVDVQVALDQVAPHRVIHGRAAVLAATDKLIVQAADSTFECLDGTRQIAERALSKLPETPVFAAGYNVRYSVDSTAGCLDRILSHDSDLALADQGFVLVQKLQKRSVSWKDGRINVTVQKSEGDDDGDKCSVHFNFEMKSRDAVQLREWLRVSISEAEGVVNQLMTKYLGMEESSVGAH